MGKSNKRSMRKGGGFWQALGYPATTDTTTTTGTDATDPTGIIGVAKKAANATVGAADYAVGTAANIPGYLGITSPDSQGTPAAPAAGGRRRRRHKRMHGGDFMPNTPLTGFSSNATEVHDIKMAQPQTLVGGRRRRRKSSKRRGRTARKSQRKSIKRSRSSSRRRN